MPAPPGRGSVGCLLLRLSPLARPPGQSALSGIVRELSRKTDCCRSDLARECRRAPIPDLGQFRGRLSAVPRNLTFGGSGARTRVSDSATRSGQRLLPLPATGRNRPIAVLRSAALDVSTASSCACPHDAAYAQVSTMASSTTRFVGGRLEDLRIVPRQVLSAGVSATCQIDQRRTHSLDHCRERGAQRPAGKCSVAPISATGTNKR